MGYEAQYGQARWCVTELDQEVFHHIVAFEFAHQRMPTLKELCFYTCMSHGQLNRHLARMVEDGRLLELPRGTIHYAIVNPERTIQPVPAHLAEDAA